MSNVPYASQYDDGGNYIELATPDPIAASYTRPLLPWQAEELRQRRLADARYVLARADRAATLDERIRAERIVREAEGGDG